MLGIAPIVSSSFLILTWYLVDIFDVRHRMLVDNDCLLFLPSLLLFDDEEMYIGAKELG